MIQKKLKYLKTPKISKLKITDKLTKNFLSSDFSIFIDMKKSIKDDNIRRNKNLQPQVA